MLKLLRELIGVQAWQAAILACASISQFVAARYIGPSGLGTSAVITASAALCIFLLELNLESAVVREISVGTSGRREALQESTLLGRLGLCVIVAPVVALWMYLDHGSCVIPLGIIVMVLAKELNPGWWLQGLGEAARSYRLIGSASLFGCLLSLPLIYLFRIPGIETVATGGVAMLVFIRFWNGSGRPIFIFRRVVLSVRTYIGFAWRYKAFLLGGAAFYLYLYPAKLILASSRSVDEAGLYGVATMFGGAYYAITMAAFNSYYPKLLVAYGEGVEHYKVMVRWVVVIITLTGLLAWSAVIVFRGLLLSMVGAQFDVSLSLAPALLLSKALGGLVLVARGALLVRRKERVSFSAFLAIELVVLALNLVIIPKYGILGASIVEISQEIFHLLLLTGMLYKFEADRVG